MLAGEGVIAIWNGITPEGRRDFYDWHVREHMPERLGINGFYRGRRYRAADEATSPEFFTLYETDRFEVLLSEDYLARLNSPTPWTRRATSHFRDTSRALARVSASYGEGLGGALLTCRFDAPEENADAVCRKLSATLPDILVTHQVTGVHLCHTDVDASGLRTAESKGRTDIQAPPRWILLIEACSTEPFSAIEHRLRQGGSLQTALLGRYALEFTKVKN